MWTVSDCRLFLTILRGNPGQAVSSPQGAANYKKSPISDLIRGRKTTAELCGMSVVVRVMEKLISSRIR
jgi:hypothetical protein